MMRERPILLRKSLSGWGPADRASADALAEMPTGAVVRVERAKARSLPQQRLYWGLLQRLAEAGAVKGIDSAEQLHLALKLALGVADAVRLPSGRIVPVARSTALDKMPAAEFSAYLERALDLICRDILPGCPETLAAEVHAMIQPRAAA